MLNAKPAADDPRKEIVRMLHDDVLEGPLNGFHKEINSISEKDDDKLRLIKSSYEYLIKSKRFGNVMTRIVSSGICSRYKINKTEAEAIALFVVKPKNRNVRFTETVNELLLANDDRLSKIQEYLSSLKSGLERLPETWYSGILYGLFNKRNCDINSYITGGKLKLTSFTFVTKNEMDYYVQGMDYSDWIIIEMKGDFEYYDVNDFSFNKKEKSLPLIDQSFRETLNTKIEKLILGPTLTFRVDGIEKLEYDPHFKGATKIVLTFVKKDSFTPIDKPKPTYPHEKIMSVMEDFKTTNYYRVWTKKKAKYFSLQSSLIDANFCEYNKDDTDFIEKNTKYTDSLIEMSHEWFDTLEEEKKASIKKAKLTPDEVSATTIMSLDIDCDKKGQSIYKAINKLLSDRDSIGFRSWRNFIYLLLSGLRKLRKGPGTILYRCIKNGITYNKGETFTWHTFTHASLDREKVEKHCVGKNPVLFEISGDYDGFDISGLSPKGYEVLIRPETTVKIESISDVPGCKYKIVAVNALGDTIEIQDTEEKPTAITYNKQSTVGIETPYLLENSTPVNNQFDQLSILYPPINQQSNYFIQHQMIPQPPPQQQYYHPQQLTQVNNSSVFQIQQVFYPTQPQTISQPPPQPPQQHYFTQQSPQVNEQLIFQTQRSNYFIQPQTTSQPPPQPPQQYYLTQQLPQVNEPSTLQSQQSNFLIQPQTTSQPPQPPPQQYFPPLAQANNSPLASQPYQSQQSFYPAQYQIVPQPPQLPQQQFFPPLVQVNNSPMAFQPHQQSNFLIQPQTTSQPPQPPQQHYLTQQSPQVNNSPLASQPYQTQQSFYPAQSQIVPQPPEGYLQQNIPPSTTSPPPGQQKHKLSPPVKHSKSPPLPQENKPPSPSQYKNIQVFLPVQLCPQVPLAGTHKSQPPQQNINNYQGPLFPNQGGPCTQQNCSGSSILSSSSDQNREVGSPLTYGKPWSSTPLSDKIDYIDVIKKYINCNDNTIRDIKGVVGYIKGSELVNIEKMYVDLCFFGWDNIRRYSYDREYESRLINDFLSVLRALNDAMKMDRCIYVEASLEKIRIGNDENAKKWMEHISQKIRSDIRSGRLLEDKVVYRGFTKDSILKFLMYTKNKGTGNIIDEINEFKFGDFSVNARSHHTAILNVVLPKGIYSSVDQCKYEVNNFQKMNGVDIFYSVVKEYSDRIVVSLLICAYDQKRIQNDRHYSSISISRLVQFNYPQEYWTNVFFPDRCEYDFVWISSFKNTIEITLHNQSFNEKYRTHIAKAIKERKEEKGKGKEKKTDENIVKEEEREREKPLEIIANEEEEEKEGRKEDDEQ